MKRTATNDSSAAPAGPSASHQSIKRRARSQFEEWALTYDRSRLNELVFFPSVRACMEEILRWQQERGGGAFRMIDVGCGTATLLTLMARDADAQRLIGLDYSPNMIRHAAEKASRLGLTDRLHLVVGDSERLPLGSESVDVLTCCNSFHHYPHQAAVIREFHRVLRPGGLLILIDGFRDNVIGWLIFDAVVARIEKNVYHVPWAEMRSFIDNAGFSAICQRKMNVLAPLLVNVARRTA